MRLDGRDGGFRRKVAGPQEQRYLDRRRTRHSHVSLDERPAWREEKHLFAGRNERAHGRHETGRGSSGHEDASA